MGRQIASDLAGAGAYVLGIGRNAGRLAELRHECEERIMTASVDVCDTAGLERAVREFVGTHGRLNGSVHAAGVAPLTPLRTLSGNADVPAIMNTSFWAGLELLRLAASPEYSHSRTSSVLFSSIAALTADKAKTAYVAAKSSLDSVARTASHELTGHRVNTILPGWVDTPMTRRAEEVNSEPVMLRHLLGIGTTEDVSHAVMFLLSDESMGLNGNNFIVDGGYSS